MGNLLFLYDYAVSSLSKSLNGIQTNSQLHE